MSAIQIRPATEADARAIHAVECAAFGRPAEADLVDTLRRHPDILSLVAVAGDAVVGHVLFTPVTVANREKQSWEAVGLGPVAVLPARQGAGIGAALIREGLARLRAVGAAAVFVLGHPGYYPRFGFQPAGPRGFRFVQEVPPEAFMVLELQAGALAGKSGTVHFLPEFEGV